MNLPVFLSHSDTEDSMVSELISGYERQYGEKPPVEQIAVWKSLNKTIKKVSGKYPLLAELPIFSTERADYIIVDTVRSLVIEAKGWHNVKQLNERVVIADSEDHIDPCYQLIGYLSKLRYFHSSANNMKYNGIVYMYNNNTYTSNRCTVVNTLDQLKSEIEKIGPPGNDQNADGIINGTFHINEDLISLLKENNRDLLNNVSNVLLGRGYGLTEEQTLLVNKIMEALKSNQDKTFLVQGESGSGKTLVAVQLLIEAVSNHYNAILGYRNNRLLNTLRQVLEIKNGTINLSSLIRFYSTGWRRTGIGEENFDSKIFKDMDLIIYDEAQRMTESVIETTKKRSRVKVYFYDDKQILIGDESGTRENFLKYNGSAIEMGLKSAFRVPGEYLKFIDYLISDGSKPEGLEYDIKIHDDILQFLEDLKSKQANSKKIALLCAFTESSGDRENPKGIKNLRIGYPLQSGFDLYRGIDVNIPWLMNEKTEYPLYWQGKIEPLSHCASVYGTQGFETDYSGLVWGRDFVWRDGWEIQWEHITDAIGQNNSIKSLAKSGDSKAYDLIRNRYYVLLTRGILGQRLFFEDKLTGDHVKSIINDINK